VDAPSALDLDFLASITSIKTPTNLINSSNNPSTSFQNFDLIFESSLQSSSGSRENISSKSTSDRKPLSSIANAFLKSLPDLSYMY